MFKITDNDNNIDNSKTQGGNSMSSTRSDSDSASKLSDAISRTVNQEYIRALAVMLIFVVVTAVAISIGRNTDFLSSTPSDDKTSEETMDSNESANTANPVAFEKYEYVVGEEYEVVDGPLNVRNSATCTDENGIFTLDNIKYWDDFGPQNDGCAAEVFIEGPNGEVQLAKDQHFFLIDVRACCGYTMLKVCDSVDEAWVCGQDGRTGDVYVRKAARSMYPE